MMNKLYIEIEIHKLVQIRQDNTTIGIWVDSGNVKMKDNVDIVLSQPMIINIIDIDNELIKNEESFDITLAVIPNYIKSNDLFRPTHGSEIYRFTCYKNKENSIILKETGWSE